MTTPCRVSNVSRQDENGRREPHQLEGQLAPAPGQRLLPCLKADCENPCQRMNPTAQQSRHLPPHSITSGRSLQQRQGVRKMMVVPDPSASSASRLSLALLFALTTSCSKVCHR